MSDFFDFNKEENGKPDVPDFFSEPTEQPQAAYTDKPFVFDEGDSSEILNQSTRPEKKGGQFDLFDYSSENVIKKESKKSKSKKRKSRVLMVLLSIFLIGVITVSVTFGAFLIWAYNQNKSLPIEQYDLDSLNGLYTTIVYIKNNDGSYSEKRLQGDTHSIWVNYDREEATKKPEDRKQEYTGIPQNMVDAAVAIEDKRFYQHQGTDWKRTFSAFANMFLHFYDTNQGGSTITQQLVKNLTNDDEQNAKRKVREILSARYLEEHYSKDTIIECYLNVISLHHNIKGVQVAANYYFGKQVNELSLAECAAIVGITKNPSSYAPDVNLEANTKRRNVVLSEMLDQGYITKDEYNEAIKEELNIVADPKMISKEEEVNSYFIDALIEDVKQEFMKEYGLSEEEASNKLRNGGYRIYATMEPDVQNALEKEYSNTDAYALKYTDKNGKEYYMQSAMTVMDYNGNVVGIVGGLGEKTGDLVLNRATSSARQPGSSIKPLSVYAPAIDANLITYSSLLKDSSKTFKNGWRANNYEGPGSGRMVTIEYAIEHSLNTIPVKILDEQLTLEKSYAFLTETLGMKHLNAGGNGDLNLSPLGMGGTSGGITTLEEASAYAIFGNHGFYYEPHFYSRITDSQGNDLRNSEGNIIFNRVKKQKNHYAISKGSADVMNHLLQNVVNNQGATAYSMLHNKLPGVTVFGKTGTTNDTADLWFSGGTPFYVASCWCGYDKVDSTGNRIVIRDSNIAKRIWGNVMQPIHKGLKGKFEDSDEVVKANFCTSTGNIAGSGCSSKVGWYKKENIPSSCKHVGSSSDEDEDSKDTEKKDGAGTSSGGQSTDGNSSDSSTSSSNSESSSSTSDNSSTTTDSSTGDSASTSSTTQ